jgi:hypothetical protein
MTTTANVTITLSAVGDVNLSPTVLPVAANLASPAQTDRYSLTSANSTVSIPTGATMLSIFPDPGSTGSVLVKQQTTDSGLSLHPTNSSSFSLLGPANGQDAVVLAASTGTVTGRLYWT